ncbi:MAG: Uma2 family endonuclease [Cyanothece sp. SIO2G6]|nr:Uma2 family endonuclease [Cyanothece sp. SIO2G6]
MVPYPLPTESATPQVALSDSTQIQGTSVVLNNISWQQYERLLEILGDRPATRLTYDNGFLEIMTPLPDHEYFKQTIGLAVNDIAEALEMDCDSYGSTTWRKELGQAGIEPDDCFYIQNEPLIRGKLEFDLTTDPPPDLAIEIDYSSKSLNRFPIYARLGIPEIWRYEAGILTVHLLEHGVYRESKTSLAFPMLIVQELPSLIEAYRPHGKRAMRRAFRQWAQDKLELF